jgi:hypothetical protein
MPRIHLQPKVPTSVEKVVFDFISRLGVGETISTQVVAAALYSGTDATPSAMISGTATASGTKVTQTITGGLVGNIYDLTCTITTSTGQTLTLSGFLAIESNLP